MRGANKSLSRGLKGTVLEILGTAFSVGCQVDGRSPKDISDDVKAGNIDSRCTGHSRSVLANDHQFLTNRYFDSDEADKNLIFIDLMIPMSTCQPQNDTSCSLEPIFNPPTPWPFSSIQQLLRRDAPVLPTFANTLAFVCLSSDWNLLLGPILVQRRSKHLLTHYSPQYPASAVVTVVHIL